LWWFMRERLSTTCGQQEHKYDEQPTRKTHHDDSLSKNIRWNEWLAINGLQVGQVTPWD
jgi:hypothetical protein